MTAEWEVPLEPPEKCQRRHNTEEWQHPKLKLTGDSHHKRSTDNVRNCTRGLVLWSHFRFPFSGVHLP